VQAAVAKKLHTTAPTFTAAEIGTTNLAQIAVRSTNSDFAAAAANDYARSYIEIATQDYVNSQLADEQQIQAHLTSVNDQIKTISATPGSATSPQLQAQLTAQYAELSSLQQQLTQIQLRRRKGQAPGSSWCSGPNSVPVSPKRVEDAAIAASVGLLLGIGFALLRDNLDDRVRGADELEEAAGGLPTIGLIRRSLNGATGRQRSSSLRNGHAPLPAEAYRTLRTSVMFLALERPGKILQVTSPGAAEGKALLRQTLHAQCQKRPTSHPCGLRPAAPPGPRILSHVQRRGPHLVSARRDTIRGCAPLGAGNENFVGAPIGTHSPNPSEILSSDRVARLFRHLEELADIVILDSSPVLPAPAGAPIALVLASRVTGVLPVAAAGITSARR